MQFALLWIGLRKFIGIVPAFVWKWLAIAAIALCIFFYGQSKGKQIERAKCEAAAAQAQQAANDQDLQAEKEGRAQDLEITDALIQQKKVDDAAIETLKAQLAKRPAGSKCLYDKSNGDPDDPASGSVRDDGQRSKKGAGDKKSPRPAVLPAARPSASGSGGS